MKAPKALWFGIVVAIGGCTQLLELDKDYRPGQSTSSSGTAGMAGNGGEGAAGGSAGMAGMGGNGNGGTAGMAGAGGMGGAGGAGGSGGGPECVSDMDCPPPVNNCTANTCVLNACVTNNLPQGTTCTPDGLTVCDGNGICGQCNQPTDCTMLPPDDECQTRACDNHVCGQTFAPNGKLLMTQTMGDCVDALCDGAGKTVMQPNNADLPEDNNPCTKNVCTNGTPSFPFEPINTSCGGALKCNDMGQCVGCITANDCAGTDDFCKTRTCNGGMCGFNFTAMGTDLPNGQTSKDCKVVECDGQGNIISSQDNTDVPVDGNPCTKDVCTAGVPSNPFEPLNTVCTGGLCNGAGACKKSNGSSCMVAGDCASAYCVEGYCCDSACGQTCKACNVPGSLGTCTIVPAGYTDDSCASPKSCDGTQGGNSCTSKFPMGYPCTLGTQCGSGMCVDGVCCSSTCTAACKSCNVAGSAGTCTNLPLGQKDGALCSGANSCDGMGVCKKDNGQACAAGTECITGICADGVCCNSACTGTCQACNVIGSVGTCSNVPSGADDSPNCTGTNSCDGTGNCKKETGQGCANGTDCLTGFCTDGVCCNVACGGICQSCNVAGSAGTCTNVPANTDDVPNCIGTNSCDGNGLCKKDNAQSCAANSDCLSNFCVDGVCCNTGCTTTCQACNLAGSLGTCSNVGFGADDSPNCVGVNSCDGMATCKKDNGQFCATNGECLNNFCVDGVCCNSACTGTCQACTAALKGQGADGTCGPIINGGDPQNECNPGACNGSGICTGLLGAACASGAECVSGFCVDNVCCDSACTATCQACNIAGALGTCSNVPIGNDDSPTCTGTNSCDGMGTCKKDNGSTCAAGGECLSNFCVDGVCCSSACTGTCQSCNVSIMTAGTCTNIPAGQDDTNAAMLCSGATVSCDGLGSCRSENGSSCTVNGQCLSNFCVDGVCCNTSCSGTCQACSAALKGNGADGTCGTINAGTDPQNECTDNGAMTCAQNGFCSGNGTCQVYAAGITCIPQSCVGTTQFNTDTCNGTGMCIDGGTTTCTPYVCGATACKTSCALDSDCTAANYCSAPACVAKKANGQACTGTNQCVSGFCIDGVCCNGGCLGTCQSCNVAGTVGSCVNLPLGTDDTVATTTCTGVNTCNGAGVCALKNGQTCNNNNNCASGNCTGTPKTCQP